MLFSLLFCIGIQQTQAQLTSYGGLVAPGTTAGTAMGQNSFFGHEAGVNTAPGFGINGRYNTFIGYESGLNNHFGYSNTFIGANSGADNINGQHNVYIGSLSGSNNEDGIRNTFLGSSAGSNAQGSNNVFLGYQVGQNEIGSNLLYIDNSNTNEPLIWGDFTNDALRFHGSVRITDIPQNNALTRILVADASGNVNWRDAATLGGGGTDDQQINLVGNQLQLEDGGNVDLSSYLDNTDSQTLSYDAGTQLLSISGGNNLDLSSLAGGGGVPHDFPSYPESAGDVGGNTNSFFGHEAGLNNTNSGFGNTFIGRQSGYNNTEGDSNTFLGRNSGFSNTEGDSNTFIGMYSGHNITHGDANTFLGRSSGYFKTEGDANTFLGANSGMLNQTGSGNVFLGHQAGYNEIGSNRLYIDNSSTSEPLIWGNFDSDILNFNGAVGIGLVDPDNTNPPTQALDVQGTARLRGMVQSSGFNRVLVADEDGNIGWRDDSSIGDSHDLPSYPASAGNAINNNSFFGDLAGALATGANNTIMGYRAFQGDEVQPNTGADNTLVGFQSGLNNTTGYENSSLGSRTLENNTTGSRNTANGVFTLFGNTIGIENTAVGYAALGFNATGNGNTATGYQTLLINNGNYNTADGYQALFNNTNGSNNTAIGHSALANNSSGFDNVAIGHDASSLNETGVENVAIGFNSGATSGDLNNTIAIGSNVGVTTSNEIRLGNLEIDGAGVPVTWTTVSDGRFKINIEEDVAGLDFIKSLRPVSYNLDRRKIRAFNGTTNATNSDVSKKIVGFIAQEVEQTIKEGNYVFTGVKTPVNEKDHYGLKYAEFVVTLTKAVQELSVLVEAQQQEIETLKNMVYGTGDTSPSTPKEGLKGEVTLSKGFSLAQNIPNPFNETTTISATIPETVRQAKIAIYNLNGLELASYDINGSGKTSVAISGGSLPSGMYLYALVADGQIIDTKKMILTK